MTGFSDLSGNEVETANSFGDANCLWSKRDIGEITNEIEYWVSKRLNDIELGQKEEMRLMENLSSNVDYLPGTDSEPCSSAEMETSCLNQNCKNFADVESRKS